MTADSSPRQPICRFTISRTPPFRLSFHLCVSRCTGALSAFPVGSSVERDSSEWSRVRSAACSVARVCRLTPLCSRTILCLLSPLHHRGRWVSLTYHDLPPEAIVLKTSLSSVNILNPRYWLWLMRSVPHRRARRLTPACSLVGVLSHRACDSEKPS